MQKKQINIRLDRETRAKLVSLAKLYGTITTATEIAIERLWSVGGEVPETDTGGTMKQVNLRLSPASLRKIREMRAEYGTTSAVVRTAISFLSPGGQPRSRD